MENNESETPSMPDDGREAVEVLAKAQGVSKAEFAAARALAGWVEGERLSPEDFTRAVQAARDFGVR